MDLEQRLDRIIDHEARSASVVRVHGRVRLPIPTPLGRAAGAGAISLLVLILAGVGVLDRVQQGEDRRPATQPAAAPTPQRIGPARPACAAASEGPVVVAAFKTGGACLIEVSTDRGQTWSVGRLIGAEAAESVLSLEIGPSAAFALAGTSSGKIFRAEHPYTEWSVVHAGSGFQPVVRSITMSAATGRIYAAVKGVVVSEDAGRTWRDMSIGLGDLRERGRFAAAGAGELGTGIVVALNGNIPEAGVWLRERDGAWRQILKRSQPIALSSDGTRAVVSLQRFPGEPAAWITRDVGRSFQGVDYGPPEATGAILTTVAIGKAGVFAGSAEGVLELRGDQWHLIMGAQLARAMHIRVGAQDLLVSTESGLWRLPL